MINIKIKDYFKVVQLKNSKAYVYFNKDFKIACIHNQYYKLQNSKVSKLDPDTATKLIMNRELNIM